MIIIPAKYSSTRLPEKNFRGFFHDFSLLQICIVRCVECKLGPVVVSSERPDLVESQIKSLPLDVSQQTIIHERDAKLARDPSTIIDVISDIINLSDEKSFENIICVLPTSPFNSTEWIKKAYRDFLSSDAERLLSVSKSSKPPYNAWVYSDPDCKNITHAFPDNPYRSVQSTRCPVTLHSNGCISIYNRSFFINKSNEPERNNIIGFMMPPESSLDIDFEFEFTSAKLAFQDFASDIDFLKSKLKL